MKILTQAKTLYFVGQTSLSDMYINLFCAFTTEGAGGGVNKCIGEISKLGTTLLHNMMHSMVVSVSIVCTGSFQVHVWGIKEKIPMIVKLQQTTYTDLLLVNYI